MASVFIGADDGGHYVEWYKDDDNNSGYGDNARVSRWYGSLDACKQRAKEREPPDSDFVPCQPDNRPSYERNAHSCVGGELP